MKKINKNVIRDHIKKRFRKEEKNVSELKHHIAIPTGKTQVSRPKGFTKEHESKSINYHNIKNEVKETFSKKDEDRVATGIPGLDEVMEGGLRKHTVNIIGGGAGSGKSICSMQYLVNGIENYKENGVYISFEESENRILEDYEGFDWKLKDKIKNKQLAILNYSPEQVNKVLEAGGGVIRDTVDAIKAKRLVIDSVTAFSLLYNSGLERRKALLQLFEAIGKWGVTAMLIAEQEEDPDQHHASTIEFEVDGVILLYNIRKGDIRERSLEVFKMRATQHAGRIFPMRIDESGITIYPKETVF
ncbi:hypothetical protein CL617_03325 [archaeon]|nr:hypothetical protein [archaeon]|tara:strand:- start:5865 stop:6770 length:906 start_codon:yes stop_codon:yes gene_type:complete